MHGKTATSVVLGSISLCVLVSWLTVGAAASEILPNNPQLVWRMLDPLPDDLGIAGAFAGIHRGSLIVAGGANFPRGMPWDGGTKAWHDSVWILDQPNGKWRRLGQLARPLAYGVTASYKLGMVCAGGSDATQHHAEVFRLSIEGDKLRRHSLPALPHPIANACGAILDGTLYIAGGIETPHATSALGSFYALDVDRLGAAWKELPPWPGPARMLAVAAVQDGSFYLISGAALSPGDGGQPMRTYLTDAYSYRPGIGWKRIADLPRPAVAAPSPAPAIGPSHILVLSGDDGSKVDYQPQSHPGFPKSVLAYHTITNTWTVIGTTPAPRATAPVVSWDDMSLVISGEVRPGVRSPEVWALTTKSRRAEFGWWNYATLALYPLIMLAISWHVGRQKTSDGYFRSGQQIPWWAAGMSIYATMLSSITFMAIPAKSFATDWSYILANASILLLAPLIVAVYLPFYRQLDVTSAYEYLERRFNLPIRWFASAAFIALQIGRTAIVLYLPALALATVSNFEMRVCIAIMGTICILMTFEGGFESVVWTDVAQTVILLAGACATLIVAWMSIPDGFRGISYIANADGKFFGDLRWNSQMTIATGWVILFGNLFITLSSYTAGQDVVQRYISTKDTRSAAKAIWANAILAVPSTVLFFAVGTALYAYYKLNPSGLDPTLSNDAVFPQFIVNELPVGLGGLVVAGIFAAAQPTSSLNSIATAWVTDFHARLHPSLSDAARLRIAKLATVISGLLGTAIALLMATFNIASAWDAFLGMLGLTGSTLAGLFALGIFSRRAHGIGAVVGAIASVALLVYVERYTTLHFFTFGAIGMLTCMAVGWFASVLIPAAPKDLNGLTIYTLRRDET